MEFKDAYNKKTGKKLRDKVPENFFDLFPNVLSRTPKQTKKDSGAKEAATKKKEDN